MQLNHPELIDLLQKAYSAEKAASFAYQGHAGSVKDAVQKKDFNIPISKWYEFRFYVIGKIISASCYVIGWFMPFYFAGRLESGNVCEYFRIKQYFNILEITKYDQILYEMGMKEKEHEIYFLEKIKNNKLLPFFEKVFSWGNGKGFNNIDLDKKYPVEESNHYCKK
jgi:rubrerythrin